MYRRGQNINPNFLETRDTALFALKTFLKSLVEGSWSSGEKGCLFLAVSPRFEKKNHCFLRIHFTIQNSSTKDNQLMQTLLLTAWVGVYLFSECVGFDFFHQFSKIKPFERQEDFFALIEWHLHAILWISTSLQPLWNTQRISCKKPPEFTKTSIWFGFTKGHLTGWCFDSSGVFHSFAVDMGFYMG